MGPADYRMMSEATGQRIAAALEAMTLDNTIADAYSSSATYAVGDYCIYNNTLYKCNTEISTAEAWTPAHWTATTVSGEFIPKTDIVDNLTSTDPTKALAAPQGKALNDKFGGVQIVPINIEGITLPDGTSSITSTIVDLSSFVPSGKSICSISNIRMGSYVLPYVENGNVITYAISLSYDNKLTIGNKSTAWNNYILRTVLFCV